MEDICSASCRAEGEEDCSDLFSGTSGESEISGESETSGESGTSEEFGTSEESGFIFNGLSFVLLAILTIFK